MSDYDDAMNDYDCYRNTGENREYFDDEVRDEYAPPDEYDEVPDEYDEPDEYDTPDEYGEPDDGYYPHPAAPR